MSLNEVSIKQQVNNHINSAVNAINTKDTNLQWARSIINSADKLSLLGRNIKSAKQNVQHFGNAQLKQAGHPGAYSVKQSIKSKTDTLDGLESYINNEWSKVRQALKKQATKAPFEDKTATELLNMLADEIESFQKLLKSNTELATKLLSNTEFKSQTTVIQREMNHLKTLPATSAPSLLLLISIGLRLASGLWAKRK